MSASLIADEIGNGATRQAVIGIAYREGIPLTGGFTIHKPRGFHAHGNVTQRRDVPKKNSHRAEHIVKAKQDITRNAAFVAELEAKAAKPLPAWIGLVSLFDLQDHHCRSVEGHDGTVARYCGRPKEHGTSWCDHHARRFVPGLFGQARL
jgi:hypothetical protein